MAVYTRVDAEDIEQFLTRYDAGSLVSAKGIAEGVENSNYLLETTTDRFILTLYEKRVNPDDLPFFLGLLDDLVVAGLPVPPAIRDREGRQIQQLAGKTACLIQFLPGVSISHPTPAQAAATGKALARMHLSTADYEPTRQNDMGRPDWHKLARDCGPEGLNAIHAGLAALVDSELEFLDEHWPQNLAISAIHADLFPDNVLMLGDEVTGLIDFYFSCTDFTAYDIAVTHAAWCFSDDGLTFDSRISDALLAGYEAIRVIPEKEREALPVLARGAALRFLLTRAYDWINTPPEAMVTRKDPMAFLNRLSFYQQHPDVFSA
ncbi:homoserine kinase [Parasphingorhabdus marina DSM 22363]|uniref:Homoserine kinase n=1 Tax=Parasphingorhabdus marina DSM 22363 TaxID=1123272 RepID=A0A1N6GW62_9SPHN|nr:homoserine kinase [Parasphingorhabdus marina]SIO11768.1 homoserine kinase [Parasphingorhabdus marina DSM 22363]